MALHFHSLPVKRFTPDAAGSAAITFQVPQDLRREFDFKPGQFLTLRATIDGQDVRRNYSICSPHARYAAHGEIDVGIKPMEGGLFSRWAVGNLREGSMADVMPPDGRFTPRLQGKVHRVGFAAGSGITPILSIMTTTLAEEPGSSFTLVYSNQRTSSIMFNEVLQDLKDQYPTRVTLVHLLSRQPQEVDLLNGRLDHDKVGELLETLIPVASIDEAFICGPEAMITGCERALLAGGLAHEKIHAERFVVPGAPPARPRVVGEAPAVHGDSHQLEIVLDGKVHHLHMGADESVLDVALDAGLDLPYSCKGGVCCTCRARVLEGEVRMEKNYTLEAAEMQRGFVLTCQSRPVTRKVVVSYDDR
ncbi:MAG: phenylacetate-CoA oxygenase/reductase subunit PaaK [Burkholderiales bacterium]|nr:phenylacetate-CoA oxygenase/reductase subunit PaaK [Burkholderiales bacterium]